MGESSVMEIISVVVWSVVGGDEVRRDGGRRWCVGFAEIRGKREREAMELGSFCDSCAGRKRD